MDQKKKRQITDLNEKELSEYIAKKRVKISRASKRREEILEQRIFSELKAKLEEDSESKRLRDWVKGWKEFRFIETDSYDREQDRGGSWIMKIVDEGKNEIFYKYKWSDTYGSEYSDSDFEIVSSSGKKFPWELHNITESGNTKIAKETKDEIGLSDVHLSDFIELLSEMIDFVAEKYEVRSDSNLHVEC